mgnify:CR=1 FL=1
MNLFQIPNGGVLISPDVLFKLGSFPVTNTLLATILVTFAIIVALALINLKGLKLKNVSKAQAMLEITVGAMYDFTENIIGNKEITKKVFPLIGTLFVYIAISNLFTTFLPFMDGFRYEGMPLFRTPTTDFNVTVSMALAMVVLSQIFGIGKKNIFRYLGNFFRVGAVIRGFRKGIGAGLLSLVDVFIGLLDIVSEIAKVVSLSLRLFGNMFAGVVIIAVLMSIFAAFLPIPIILLSLLSGVIQAIVFGALVSSYFSSALSD